MLVLYNFYVFCVNKYAVSDGQFPIVLAVHFLIDTLVYVSMICNAKPVCRLKVNGRNVV